MTFLCGLKLTPDSKNQLKRFKEKQEEDKTGSPGSGKMSTALEDEHRQEAREEAGTRARREKDLDQGQKRQSL